MDDTLIDQVVQLMNGHPFYLQVIGEELCLASSDQTITPEIYKSVIQQTLFDSTGRLHLYFNGQYIRHIKQSASLEKVLISIAEGHHRVSEVARDIGVVTGVASSWIGRLVAMDLVKKVDDTYQFCDPVFGLWIVGTRSIRRATIAPSILGDEGERQVARHLGREGFHLVYQSRASRGAFDLLALLNSFAVGLQVKTIREYPVYVEAEEYTRMEVWGQKLGWEPIFCLWKDGQVAFVPLTQLVKTGNSYRIDEGAGSNSLLRLLLRKESNL